MKRRLNLCLELLAWCILFTIAETVIYALARAPIDYSLQLASSGPLAIHTSALLDRLAEWRAQTPELGVMLVGVASSTALWALAKHLGFPWLVLRRLRGAHPTPTGPAAYGIQTLWSILLCAPVALGLWVCAQGLASPAPGAYLALGALFLLFGMLKVSRDRSLAHLAAGAARPYSLRPTLRGLGDWLFAPGSMSAAWLLWLAQMAAAAAPALQQLTEHPGPCDPRTVIPYVGTSFLLWALRLWVLWRSVIKTKTYSTRD